MEQIIKYFPNLSERQLEQLSQLEVLYRDWNEQINVISRKDIENLYAHHVLHSMAIAKLISFKKGASILDLGTGGGLPGIPLAILFPDTSFTLVDGTGKKIKVADAISREIGLRNVKTLHIRAEEVRQKFDFVVCRAVASLDKLVGWSRRLVAKKHQHALPNGLITLKGGDIRAEKKLLHPGEYVEVFPLSDWFELPFFEEKYIVYVQL